MPPVFFTPAIVMKHIKHLRPNASPGLDGIPAEFFKATASFVSLPLSVIFSISLQTGELPSIWKHACITPVFKKGSSSNPACRTVNACWYRPSRWLYDDRRIDARAVSDLRQRTTGVETDAGVFVQGTTATSCWYWPVCITLNIYFLSS